MEKWVYDFFICVIGIEINTEIFELEENKHCNLLRYIKLYTIIIYNEEIQGIWFWNIIRLSEKNWTKL